MSITATLKSRGLIKDSTCDSFDDKDRFYVGFDPTADGLHVGSLLPIVISRFLVSQNKQVTLLIGTATAKIGDPSGKSKERSLLSQEQIETNHKAVQASLTKLVPGATIVANHSWINQLSLFDFLRTIGKHVSVKKLLNMDSVKSRMDSEQGISFTEFSYSLFQAFDFAWLANEPSKRIEVQFGGSDQWGNILAGIDLASKMFEINNLQAFTFPLLTKQDGTKFGKTESGAVWLDKTKLTPFGLFQFFVRLTDEETKELFPKLCLHLSDETIKQKQETLKGPRELQTFLAKEMVNLVHGSEELKEAENQTKLVFETKSNDSSSLSEEQIFICKEPSIELMKFIVEVDWCKSNNEARRLINAGGIKIDDVTCVDQKFLVSKETHPQGCWIVKGKKHKKFLKFND